MWIILSTSIQISWICWPLSTLVCLGTLVYIHYKYKLRKASLKRIFENMNLEKGNAWVVSKICHRFWSTVKGSAVTCQDGVFSVHAWHSQVIKPPAVSNDPESHLWFVNWILWNVDYLGRKRNHDCYLE